MNTRSQKLFVLDFFETTEEFCVSMCKRSSDDGRSYTFGRNERFANYANEDLSISQSPSPSSSLLRFHDPASSLSFSFSS
jgi:hypothetical protein